MPSLVPLADISGYHADAEASLRLYYSLQHSTHQARFTGYFPSEVAAELIERLDETEMRSALVILARIEAAFRVDYKVRATSKRADPVSVGFRRLHATKSDRARLEDEILEVWRQNLEPADRAVISQLRGMLKYRHWLAHGRYWQPGVQHTFQDVYLLAYIILSGFDLEG